MPSVFKPAGRTKYRFEYRDAADQLKTYATGVSDKRAAEQIMRDVCRRVEREKAGLPVARRATAAPAPKMPGPISSTP